MTFYFYDDFAKKFVEEISQNSLVGHFIIHEKGLPKGVSPTQIRSISPSGMIDCTVSGRLPSLKVHPQKSYQKFAGGSGNPKMFGDVFR